MYSSTDPVGKGHDIRIDTWAAAQVVSVAHNTKLNGTRDAAIGQLLYQRSARVAIAGVGLFLTRTKLSPFQ